MKSRKCRKHRCVLEMRMIGPRSGEWGVIIYVCPICEKEERNALEKIVARIRKLKGQRITVEIKENKGYGTMGWQEEINTVRRFTGILEEVDDLLSSVTISGKNFLYHTESSGSGGGYAIDGATQIISVKRGKKTLFLYRI